MKRILIVEDDSDLNRGLCMALTSSDVQLVSCLRLQQARQFLQKQEADLLLLDINLPDGSGLDFLQEVRQRSEMPIILLTANDTEMDVVMGLEYGADDYITKPFSLAILRARVHAQLRRKDAVPVHQETPIYRQGPFSFDFARMEFRRDSELIVLSKTEQRLLRLLVENRGITLSRGQLLDRIWRDGADYVDENALSVTVKRLRDKLQAGMYIKTVYGIGYVWKESADDCC